jgi:hypothetical protein
MPGLEFQIVAFLGSSIKDPLERESLASLRITAGPNRIPLTEVEDTIAHSVRDHINVPIYSLARWLVVNWWRLRWEPQSRSPNWLFSHSIAAIGGDYAWPSLTFSSDGEFIQIRLQAETSTDVSAIRYLRDVAIEIPASDFEQAIDRFLDQTEARIATRLPGDRELSELREELHQERQDAQQALSCKLQALAGLDPGSASAQWMQSVKELVDKAGVGAAEEIVAVAPMLHGGLAEAHKVISAMSQSRTTVNLDWVALEKNQPLEGEVPWMRGMRLAESLRTSLNITSGRLPNSVLEQLLDAKLPLPESKWVGGRHLRGGYRNGINDGRTALLVTTPREDNQRFYLARLIGAALCSSAEQHVLPVSDADTALQKFERAFAQELLCPWKDLDAFTDQYGTDEEGIEGAAAHFSVSELLVLSTLVNKGKLPRSRLQSV